jgi:hypothetical protein
MNGFLFADQLYGITETGGRLLYLVLNAGVHTYHPKRIGVCISHTSALYAPTRVDSVYQIR